jgi:hypothetical protein
MLLKTNYTANALCGAAVYNGAKFEIVDSRDTSIVDVKDMSKTGYTIKKAELFYQPFKNFEYPIKAVRSDHFSIGMEFPADNGELVAVFKGHGALGGDIDFLIKSVNGTLIIVNNDQESITKMLTEDYSSLNNIESPSYIQFKPSKVLSFDAKIGTMVYYAYARNKSQKYLKDKKGGLCDHGLFKTDWFVINLRKLAELIYGGIDLPRFCISDDSDFVWVLADSSNLECEAVLIDEDGNILKSSENYKGLVLSLM